ncbi:MAG: chromosome segregation protein SMC [Lachnospiraceae bacterium]|nr:chromosome segregation protein SMC [Lachnospiraceae bacterium]
MYLKSIEIHGFKSFANKIVFEFHNGITGIVGPNGSGKSNVADAVRWVLGEQRVKQLRGASMQDVIFSGTELRKMQSYAYVAITLDNSDRQLPTEFDEVTVARRIYRSGESEYLLNGTPCRLKDVSELFYDTGIGKEGYSIIGQGQIDAIMHGKPEEHRELFDEAAGIVKFKKRKAASLKKLESVENNLVRITDILGELEKQVGPLEAQSEKAKVYLKKKEELKTVDVNVFLLENESVTTEMDKVTEKHEVALRDLQAVKASYDASREEYDRLSKELEELEATIEEERRNVSETTILRGKLEGQIALLKEQIRSARSNEEHFHDRKSAIEKAIADKEEEKKGILKEKEEVDNVVKEVRKAQTEAQTALDAVQKKIEELNSGIEGEKNRIIDTINNRSMIKSRQSRYDSMTEQINLRKSELTSRILRIRSDEAKQEENIREQEAEFNRITEELKKLAEDQETKEEQLALVREELQKKDEELRDTQVKYHQGKSTLEALTNLTERYEGYGGAVKSVMEQKDYEKGIIGVVADIIKVDPKYEVAIETALGGNIQNIVTEDEEAAKRMIEYLKKHRAGRATFLPLTTITHPQEFKTPEVLEEKGVIGMADELVKTEKKYRNVAKAMLGRIVVINNVDRAVEIARKYDFGIRMVTLEGELLVPGGAIAGGAFKNSSNLLSRRREMDELTEKIKGFAKRIDEILNEIEDTKKKRNRIRLEIEECKGLQQRKLIEQNTARLNVDKAAERKNEAAAGTAELKNEELEIEKQIREIAEFKSNTDKELKDSEEVEEAAKKKIAELEEILKKEQEEETVQLQNVHDKDVEAEKVLQQQQFHQTNVERIDSEIETSREELKQVEESLSTSLDDVDFKEKSITELTETIKASHTTQSDTEKKLSEDVEKKDGLSEALRKCLTDRDALAEKSTGLDKEVFRLASQKEQLENKLSSRVQYMWEEYELTLTDAAALKDEEMKDLGALRRNSQKLRGEIKALGDVNVNAIEDYKNVLERYTFQKTQHDDLTEAKTTLGGIIKELDEAMRKQFEEKFLEIDREFNKVFRELFGGGDASLKLMEGEDVLEAGIQIIAQPPGKKLSNMMQLSGGEKSLTAIALLFAIQNLKPSPFCLLDEIEAALDESNVSRFANYLHKLTKHTQFIVITHRRGTMEKADRLYGITMQEKGVSALVSVNLIDDELED